MADARLKPLRVSTLYRGHREIRNMIIKSHFPLLETVTKYVHTPIFLLNRQIKATITLIILTKHRYSAQTGHRSCMWGGGCGFLKLSKFPRVASFCVLNLATVATFCVLNVLQCLTDPTQIGSLSWVNLRTFHSSLQVDLYF